METDSLVIELRLSYYRSMLEGIKRRLDSLGWLSKGILGGIIAGLILMVITWLFAGAPIPELFGGQENSSHRQNVSNYSISLIRCVRDDDQITCLLSITNNRDTESLTIYSDANPIRYSAITFPNGQSETADAIRLNGGSETDGYATGNFVQGVENILSIQFDGVINSSQTLETLAIRIQNQSDLDQFVIFRGIRTE